jgi:release factor glutamine methyltransferase
VNVGAALARARALGLERLDAQLLLAHTLQQPRSWLIAHDDAALTPAQQQAFAAACRRRVDGEPVAYLLGEREFHGLMLQVSPAVLVPRPDTETLVDWALELLRGALAEAPQLADLGTGSGAIALALKHQHPAAHVCAVELSAAALEVARANAARLGLELEFMQGSWWQPLRGRRFHLVVSNPPYIVGDDPHLDALCHEPALALSPGGDGLAALRQIVREAPAQLHADGWLLLEHGHDQQAAVQQLLAEAGFVAVHTRADLAGRPRCSGGRLPQH